MALVDKVIWQIECHRDAPLSVASLSEACAVSVHHMCRAFQMATGQSVMAYARARRLSVAATEIADGADDILQVALSAGYGSHEAFTRAFMAYLGVLPSTVKQTRDLSTLSLMEPFEMQKDMIVDVAKPEIRDRGAFRVAGLGTTCKDHDISAIPSLWQGLNARAGEFEDLGPGYGVSYAMEGNGDFKYLAGMEARTPPAGMEVVEIPAHRYAIFTHRGHVADLPKTIYTIWNKALPDSELSPAPAPEFELYDQRFDVATGRGEIEVWIPVT
ncbi:AraC family transcriptional regulator [Gymnodinialimonas sp. 2305UL16-5]|uniref:AraC family transcriptional regulator n=1 Tax=Gymnodinialimonas mytili TaxID=3126503 RepID=UPI0030A1E603